MNKIELRNKFRQIKFELLTKYNANDYHSKLRQNFLVLLKKWEIESQRKNVLIGSYINKPIYEIIPPMIHTQNFHYAYPFFSTKSRNMQFYEHLPENKYQIGPYVIKRLVNHYNKEVLNEKLDIVLVPLVSFTKKKQRIGEGGGYYDQFIRESREKQKLYKRQQSKNIRFIGIALQRLKYERHGQQIFEELDQPLDAVITQKSIYL